MHYDVIEFKSFYESPPRRIAELEEARGELLGVFEAEGQTVATFEWGAVSLPGELRKELRALVGKGCAILRLDGRYHIRAVGNV